MSTFHWPHFAVPIVAVVVIENSHHAVPLARALRDGGITTVEVTMRTPAGYESIAAIAERVPEVTVGAGTVLSANDCAEVKQRGASFAVAPGTNPSVVEAAHAVDLPFAPGVSSPTEIEQAIGLGCRTLKVFPAQALGGPTFLAAIAAPYRHLGLTFMPTGGVKEETVSEWLDVPGVVAVGGTWLARPDDIHTQNWDEVTTRATRAVEAIR